MKQDKEFQRCICAIVWMQRRSAIAFLSLQRQKLFLDSTSVEKLVSQVSSRNQGFSQRQREAMEREPGNEACSNSNSELSFEHETWSVYENEENWENIAATQQRMWLSKHVTSSRRAWENESAMSFVRSAVRDCSHSLCLEQVQLFAKIWLFLSLIGRVKFLIYGVRSTTVIFSSYGTC